MPTITTTWRTTEVTASKKTDPTTVAAKARTEAEAAVEAARTELEQAEAHRADLRAKLSSGDGSITPQALVEADAGLDRGRLLLDAAHSKLAAAQDTERRTVAAATAEALSGREWANTADAEAEALKALTETLAKFRSVLSGSNSVISRSVATARDAGLVEGQVDPLSSVKVTRRGVLVVEGREVQTANVPAALIQLAENALDALGIDVEITAA